MSKVWKLHKHFLTSLLLVFLFTFAFGAFMAVNDAMGQTMDNKEDTVANVYISESAFESSYEDAYETMHDAEIKVKELQGLYDEALSTKELLANTSGGDTKRMLSILEKHIKSYKEAEKEFKEAEEKFNELEKKATESKYNSRRRDFMKKRAIFEDPPIQKDAHVAYEHQKQTPKRKSEILTTNQEDNGICQLFTIFFNAASVVTKKSIDMFSKPMMQLLVIAFAIWIALQIVAFVSAPEVRDLKDLVSSIINKSFIIMILVGLLSTGAINFFNNFLSPIYTTGQKLAQTILTADNFEFEKDVLPSYCEGSSNVYDEKKGALPKEMGDSILCTMELIQQKASVVEELGKECLKKSWKERFIIIPHFGYLFVGLGLWIGAMLIILGVPFIMIDVVFQMAVAGALLPFGIAAFAFKPTSGYSKKIWETFLNSVFAFIFVSLISLMLCELFIETVVDNYGSTTVDNVLINIPWFGVEFLKVCFVCILAWAILPTAKDFAKEFSGAISSTKFGEGAATIAASATKSFAVKAGKETLEATVTNTGKAIKSGFGMAVGGIRNATRNSQAKRFMRKGTKTADGQYEVTRKNGTKFTVRQSADGSFSVEKTKKNGKRKIQTEDFTIVTDKHGNTSVRYNTHDARNMFDDSGKLEKGKDGTRFEKIQEKYLKEHLAAKARFENAKEGDSNYDQLKADFERTGFILTATTQAAVEQRMPYASKKTGGKELKRVPQFDDNGKYIGYDAVMEDGSVRKIRINMSAPDKSGKSRLYTEVTNIDKNGKGETLRSNGMIQAKSTFKTKDGKASGEIDDESRKTSYGLSAHHEERRQHSSSRYLDREMQNGGTFGFSSDEAKDINHVVAKGGAGFSEFGRYHA